MCSSLKSVCVFVQAEKQKMLADAEKRRQRDLTDQHKAELAQLKEKVTMKFKVWPSCLIPRLICKLLHFRFTVINCRIVRDMLFIFAHDYHFTHSLSTWQRLHLLGQSQAGEIQRKYATRTMIA